MLVDRSQRWRDRRERYVPAASEIDPSTLSVDIIDCMKTAKPFIEKTHYSGSFPASRLSLGLFQNGKGGRSRLVGACTFSQPMNNASVPLRTGLDCHRRAVDLGRFVLLDDVAGNGETWFLSRAMRALRREKPEVLSVISYADPVQRVTADGAIIKPGHIGRIYAVMGAAYRGRASARIDTLCPDGQPFNDRKLSKIRSGEQGHAYSVDGLVSVGAPAPTDDDLRGWLAGLYATGFLTRRRHPGNHVYVFEMTRAARLAARGLPRLQYPQLDAGRGSRDVTALPLLQTACT
ncbi:hypothetical protein [Brevundimonas sp.]|uniref:Mom family adenine methylcarbamoylation protein n=1 Tax=Brevundimonas sp. TaxID=1871086 RepID=UPI0027FF6D43|nr:hypothetical protein [Brevundimonas sp.]MDQ7814099.1 hypothetical protein [Brevundimonas sp.]